MNNVLLFMPTIKLYILLPTAGRAMAMMIFFMYEKDPVATGANPLISVILSIPSTVKALCSLRHDGKTAYYASDRSDSKGGLDIYSFELREDVRPNKTLWVKGQVFDKKTTKGLPSAVELIDLASKRTDFKSTDR